MSHKTIHLHQNRLNREVNVFLLLIPSIIFVLVLLISLYYLKLNQTQVFSDTFILGEEDQLDNNPLQIK